MELNMQFVTEVSKLIRVKTDVTIASETFNLVKTTLAEFGKIDILVNNAGVQRVSRLIDMEERVWDFINKVNAKGVYLMTKAVVPHMIASRYGKIVNISSGAGREGYAGFSHYCASKFAVIGFTQSLAKELAEFDINVNAVCPGIVRTQMWEGMLDDFTQSEKIPREEIFEKWVQEIPLRRPQTGDDIANAVLFLCSDISRNITGQKFGIDGGLRMD
jgi:NAD(P)-dependent dehydrogenase (short-subunit alcohol dehydrogenase family)